MYLITYFELLSSLLDCYRQKTMASKLWCIAGRIIDSRNRESLPEWRVQWEVKGAEPESLYSWRMAKDLQVCIPELLRYEAVRASSYASKDSTITFYRFKEDYVYVEW